MKLLAIALLVLASQAMAGGPSSAFREGLRLSKPIHALALELQERRLGEDLTDQQARAFMGTLDFAEVYRLAQAEYCSSAVNQASLNCRKLGSQPFSW